MITDQEDGVCAVYKGKDDVFIAHARTDNPALCAIVREQDKRIADLETQLQERTEAAQAWDALAVARLQEINAKADQIAKLEAENKKLKDAIVAFTDMFASGPLEYTRAAAGSIALRRLAG